VKKRSISTDEILTFLRQENIDFTFHGTVQEIDGFSSVYQYEQGTVTWLKNYGRFARMKERPESVSLLVAVQQVWEEGSFDNVIVCDNPKYVFYRILTEFFYEEGENLSEGSVIHPTVQVGKGTQIGSGCVIEQGVVIGSNTRIYHNVVIRKGTHIGDNCVIKSGTVIGEEGYGLCDCEDGFYHVPHFGNVVIGDRVEVGANCCIDRGTMSDTVIGDGCKIGNLCNVAHNVKLGRNVRLVVGVNIAGSTTIEEGVYVAPGGVINNQVTVGQNSLVGIGSVVLGNIEDNKVVVGVPAKVLREAGNEEL
jgi:UDP-3-O-[3-hydroxymyristoyl] glucosamine N-acyltransferase